MGSKQDLDPKLVARIHKLHAMAESAREVGSLAEADSFMAAVQKTLAYHNLDSSILTLELHNLTDPMGMESVNQVGSDPKKSRHKESRKSVAWAVDLGVAVAKAHYCACNFSAKGTYLYFYGRKTNRDMAVRMYTYLRDMAERLAWDANVTEAKRRRQLYGHERGTGQYRLNWLEGFVDEVARRYRDMRHRLDHEDRSLALVLVKTSKEADAEARRNISFKGAVEYVDADYDIWQAKEDGAKAAKDVNLQPRVLEENSTLLKRIR